MHVSGRPPPIALADAGLQQRSCLSCRAEPDSGWLISAFGVKGTAKGGQRTWISVCPDEDEEEKSRWRLLLTDCNLRVSNGGGVRHQRIEVRGGLTFDGWISHVRCKYEVT